MLPAKSRAITAAKTLKYHFSNPKKEAKILELKF